LKQLPEGAIGQVLALAIAALVLVIFYLAILSPIFDFYGAREDLLDQRVAMAGRYETLAHALPALRVADKKWLDQSGGELLLGGSSDALASAALQSVIKSLADDAGANISSSEMLQPLANGNFRRVGVRVVLSGDLKHVAAVLRGVETSRPVLSVGDFSLRAGGAAAESAASDEDSEAPAGADGTLSVTLDVYGFRAA
jgi:hypothetical protein